MDLLTKKSLAVLASCLNEVFDNVHAGIWLFWYLSLALICYVVKKLTSQLCGLRFSLTAKHLEQVSSTIVSRPLKLCEWI